MPHSALDREYPRIVQTSWLEHGGIADLSPLKTNSKGELHDRIRKVSNAATWHYANAFVGRYLSTCVFSPNSTVEEWWCLTIPKPIKQIRVNVGQQEVLTVSLDSHKESYLIVDGDVGAILEIPPEINIEFAKSPYLVSQQTKIASKDLKQLGRALDQADIAKAARKLTLELMRSSRSRHRQHHSKELLSLIA